MVLIETYWNVKILSSEWIQEDKTVLIETYWNVKVLKVKLTIPLFPRINRNILECKVFCTKKGGLQAECINRNILECKVARCLY